MNSFILEPDFDTPNKFYVYDMRDGKKILAIFYDVMYAREFINYLINSEEQGKHY